MIADPSAIASEPQPAPTPISIPPDVVLTLKLAQAIDTDTAAAGDVVVATVSNVVPVTVIQKGSTVRGRIVLMQHLLAAPRSFVIAIQLETVEIDGHPSPLYAIRPTEYEPWTTTKAMFEHRYRSRPIFLPPGGQSRLVSNFSFFSNDKRHVMPRGYETQWITVARDDVTEPRP